MHSDDNDEHDNRKNCESPLARNPTSISFASMMIRGKRKQKEETCGYYVLMLSVGFTACIYQLNEPASNNA